MKKSSFWFAFRLAVEVLVTAELGSFAWYHLGWEVGLAAVLAVVVVVMCRQEST